MANVILTGDTSVYWIKLPEHTDIMTEGYIGVSRNVDYRLNQHKNLATNSHLVNAIKKYGWDSLVKKVMLISDEVYCLMIEKILRSKENTGWNIAIGGGKPPIYKGGRTLSEETKAKISNTKTGVKLVGANLERAKKQILEIGKNTRFIKGIKFSKETIEKFSKARIGKKLSNETKAKISKKRLAYFQRIREEK